MGDEALSEPQPAVAYLRLNTPLWLILLGKGLKPSTWVDEFAELVGAVWAFPSSVTAARDRRRLAAAQASAAVKAALGDSRLDEMFERQPKVVFVLMNSDKGDPEELVARARSQ
jgi:hypothetical protein